jgi:hypothetical protein
MLRKLVLYLRPTQGRDRLPIAVAWAAGLLCLVALVHRFHFGADVTDETFSIALPYRFALGDRPFVDEISIQQTSGLILFPFVLAYVKLTGGTTGIVLFVRFVHLFVVKGVAALGVYAAGRRLLARRSSAIAVSFVAFAFVPHSIPNVGYNVLGMSLLIAGTFLCAAAVAEPDIDRRFRLLLCAGFCQGIMAFAYPPMAVAPILATPLVVACARRRRLDALGGFALGGFLAFASVVPALGFGGLAGIRRSLGWGVHANQVHTWKRLVGILEPLWDGLPAFYPYALAAVALAFVLRSRRLVAVVVPCVTLALLFWNRDESATYVAPLKAVIYIGAFAPAMFLLAKPDWTLLGGALLIILPSTAAAVAAGYTSTQGPNAASLGLFACAALFGLLAVRALERTQAAGAYCILPPLALMFSLVTHCYDFVYRDGRWATLTATVKAGPFKGIRTTEDRAQAFAELSAITAQFDKPNGRILILYESPGLYLFSRMRPAAHCVWEVSHADQEGLLAYWQGHMGAGGIVVRQRGSAPGSIDAIVAPPDRKVTETPHFVVYKW